ncbi:hypothetical protein [Bacillus cabrialesii]|uniref:hypothetical protein n=1 Tax=Bacillus cabrialesii TaxID=2487276 RepID=UPI00207B10E7|nr:hypothetical protein [Bacillus cabrialesii]
MKELKQYTAWRAMGDKTIHKRMHLLGKCKRIVEVEIQTLQQNLLVLNRKIEFYLSCIKMKTKSHKNKWSKAEGDF